MTATLLSIERFIPPYRYEQTVVTEYARRWLSGGGSATASRLLSVYQAAGVKTRGSVLPIEDVFNPGDFETQNDRYREAATRAAIDVSRRALEAAALRPSDVAFVVSVSCTGFMIPALDAHVADALGMGPLLARLPVTESGCAGGVVGLARAADYLTAHPHAAALVVAVELSSLTFQPWDRSAANVVSCAIFGDGGAALVLVGPEHPRARNGGLVSLTAFESVFFPATTHLMGFRLRNQGLQMVLDRGLAAFVKGRVGPGVDGFLDRRGLEPRDITRWILHPGGRRIVEAMNEALGLTENDAAATAKVLEEHGNMSSVTVLYVLDEMLRRHAPGSGERGLVAAFGPGFCAELGLVEFA